MGRKLGTSRVYLPARRTQTGPAHQDHKTVRETRRRPKMPGCRAMPIATLSTSRRIADDLIWDLWNAKTATRFSLVKTLYGEPALNGESNRAWIGWGRAAKHHPAALDTERLTRAVLKNRADMHVSGDHVSPGDIWEDHSRIVGSWVVKMTLRFTGRSLAIRVTAVPALCPNF